MVFIYDKLFCSHSVVVDDDVGLLDNICLSCTFFSRLNWFGYWTSNSIIKSPYVPGFDVDGIPSFDTRCLNPGLLKNKTIHFLKQGHFLT